MHIFAVVGFLFTLGNINGYLADAVGNANHYIDEVLENFRNEPEVLSKVEPLEIPEVKDKNFYISNGSVQGLSTLYRHGDCSISYDEKDDLILVTVQVAVKDIKVYVKYGAKALLFWIKGHATLSIDDAAVKMTIALKKGKASVHEFKVVNLGKYKIRKITGMSVVLNWLYKLIANTVAKNSKKKIINALETGVSAAVNDLLNKFELPDLGRAPLYHHWLLH